MNIHILAIAGKSTAPLAVELKNHGHHVTGSDQDKIYPPVSTLLEKNNIPINETNISKKINLVIVGSSYKKFSKTREEYDQAKLLKIPTISATKYINQHITKENSIIIAGSYGKTTITGLVSLILINASLDPSYLIGGTVIKSIPSVKINSSQWSVIEGDESINGLDDQAKFLYFKTKYVIITSVGWEHHDSYPTQKDNLNTYKQLVKNIPSDGLLIYNPFDSKLKKIAKLCKAPTLPYDSNLEFNTPLIGAHNIQNIKAAYTLCKALNIDDSIIKNTIEKYLGISRRLEQISVQNNIIFIDDFAQSSNRIKSSLDAIKTTYPNRPIKLFFEPRASFLLQKKSLKDFGKHLKDCQQVVIAKIPYKKSIKKSQRSTAKDFSQQLGNKSVYIPLYDQIVDHYKHNLSPGDILVHMSSGGQTGQIALSSIIRHFKNNPKRY